MRCTWDLENIGTLARRVDQEKERVNRQIAELEKCKSELATAFQGDAGQAMQEAMAADLQRMQEFSKQIGIQADKLRAVGDRCYETCEETLRSKMSEVEANMK